MEDYYNRMKTRPTTAILSRAMRSRKSVVCVIVKKPPSPDNELGLSYGSGFVIRDGPPSSLVLTCQHVVEGVVSVRIRMVAVGAGVQEFAATVIRSDEVRDIAVLHVPGLRSERSLALNFSPPLQVNEPAVTIGYCNPKDLLNDEVSLARLPATLPGCIREAPDDFLEELRVEDGKRIIGDEDGVLHELILLNCLSITGVSGGPVVDKHGVIGMATKTGIDMSIMLAVSFNTIRGVLKGFAGLPANGLATMEEVVSRL